MRIDELAERLAESPGRFLTEVQMGPYQRHHGFTRDEVRTAAVLADRIRRRRQLSEGISTFRVDGLVDIDAPVILPVKEKPKRARRMPGVHFADEPR